MRIGETVFSPNYGGDLAVVGAQYPATATADEVARGAVRPESFMASADGRGWCDAMHQGAESAEPPVYVERHTIGGCVFHGWIDAASRRVVQTG